MGGCCSKLTCMELCCSETVTDIGEEWASKNNNGSLYNNDQLPNKVEKAFEIAIEIISAFHFVVAVGILIFGIYTYNLREEIRHGNQHMVKDAVIYQMSLVPIYLIIVGCIVIFFSLIGAAGVMRHHIPLMITYLIFLLTYTIVQLVCACIALTMRMRIENAIYSYFGNDAIEHYRDDIDLQNLIDFIQLYYGCCGGSDNTGYLDWSKNIYFKCTSNNPSFERCSVPYTCCLGATDPSSPGSATNTYCGYQSQRKTVDIAKKYIHTGGCVKAMFDSLQNYSGYLVAAICGLIIVPIILEIMLVLLIRDVLGELRAYREWEAAMKSKNPEEVRRAEEVADKAEDEISPL